MNTLRLLRDLRVIELLGIYLNRLKQKRKRKTENIRNQNKRHILEKAINESSNPETKSKNKMSTSTSENRNQVKSVEKTRASKTVQ